MVTQSNLEKEYSNLLWHKRKQYSPVLSPYFLQLWGGERTQVNGNWVKLLQSKKQWEKLSLKQTTMKSKHGIVQ